MSQRAIPFMQFRGGSSKGLFFRASDLPGDPTQRDQLILAAMEGVGCGDSRQIDGLGGATSLTSKAAIVSLSKNPDADLDYLGAVSTATACLLPGSVAEGLAVIPAKPDQGYSVEHPSGEFTVQLELIPQHGVMLIGKSGVIRTARLLSRCEALVPLATKDSTNCPSP